MQKPRDGSRGVSVCASRYKVGAPGPGSRGTEQCAESAGRNRGGFRLRFPLQGRSPPNTIPAKTAELLSQLKEYRRKPGRNSAQNPRDGSRGVSVCASRYKVGAPGPGSRGTEQCAAPAGRNRGGFRLRFPLQGRSPPNTIPAKTAELLSQHKEYGRKPGRNSVQKPRDGSRGVSVGASRYKVAAMAQVCPHCQKRFPFPSNLRRHVSAVHLKERPFACAECHKSFATQRNLELHVRIRHRDERPHQCHLCSYRCHLPADLRKHLESHVRGRRLGCRREDLVAAWLEEAGLAFERTTRIDFCDGEEPELARLDFVVYRE